MILVPAFFVALPLMLLCSLHIIYPNSSLQPQLSNPRVFKGGRMWKREMELGVSYGQYNKGGMAALNG